MVASIVGWMLFGLSLLVAVGVTAVHALIFMTAETILPRLVSATLVGLGLCAFGARVTVVYLPQYHDVSNWLVGAVVLIAIWQIGQTLGLAPSQEWLGTALHAVFLIAMFVAWAVVIKGPHRVRKMILLTSQEWCVILQQRHHQGQKRRSIHIE